MSRTRFNKMFRQSGWLVPAVMLALVPKCLLCVLAYLGLGTALGFGGQELCGQSASLTDSPTLWFVAFGASVGIFPFLRLAVCSGKKSRIH